MCRDVQIDDHCIRQPTTGTVLYFESRNEERIANADLDCFHISLAVYQTNFFATRNEFGII